MSSRPLPSMRGDSVSAHARKSLEDQILVHEKSILELKTRINRLALTTRLPPRSFATEHYESRRWAVYGIRHPYGWIALTHVCRAWREIALNTPRLWSRIVLKRPEMATEALARSKKAPLSFLVQLTNPPESQVDVLEKVIQESERLVQLQISSQSRLVYWLSSKWELAAPFLEDITITTDLTQLGNDSDIPSLPLSPKFFSGKTPSLRRLKLCMVPFDWTHPFFCSTLRTLDIQAPYDLRSNPAEFSQLLLAFERMPLLESVNLHEGIPHLPEGLAQLPAEAARSVVLPNLRSLEVVSNTQDAANFLRHLAFPSSAQFFVCGLTPVGAESLIQVFSDRLSGGPPRRTMRIEQPYPSQIEVDVWNGCVELGALDQADRPRPDAQLAMEVSLSGPQSHTLQTLAVNTAFLPELHRLDMDLITSGWDYKTLFRRLPALQVLSLSGPIESNFFDAFATLASSEDTDADANAPLLPSLHTIELHGARVGGLQARDGLLDLLIQRCHLGVPIQRLVLRACFIRAAEFVSHVAWDESEQSQREDYFDPSIIGAHRFPLEQFMALEDDGLLNMLFNDGEPILAF
ncbi:hypothetical protein C2E23DRAFT_807655 [Lenzites betulinus]|nr:hypothetical protein C2E23DRAFT_807655 [Lenzites betulinus]